MKEEYCIYLRKSRADIEAEAHGEGETLARHERLLLELAKRQRLNVTEIYREIVSGDTIAARPVMQQLLQEVEAGRWCGVLVVEVERLARGETIDQGIVARTFQYTETKIITPVKTYDPTNEYDQEYFEFGLFMSRREYKTINRRLVRGREAAAKEGKWVSGSCPYGYERVRIEDGKGWTLKVIPDEADIVKLIYQLYTQGKTMPDGTVKDMGAHSICRTLEDMNITSPGGVRQWRPRTINQMLQNPAYIGKVRWNRRRTRRKIEDGNVIAERYVSDAENWIISEGLHEAIIDADTFQKAADKLAEHGPAPVHLNGELKNAFSGIAICEKCGKALTLWSGGNGYRTLKCRTRYCDNVGIKYEVFEARILAALSDWLGGYELNWNTEAKDEDEARIEIAKKALEQANQELEAREKQLARTHELLELDVYDVDTFLDRSRVLAEQIAEAKANRDKVAAELHEAEQVAESKELIIPKVKKLMEVYDALPNAAAKNELLKGIVEKITYRRDSRKGGKDNFEVTIFPKLKEKRG